MSGIFAAALADRYHLERELGAGGMATVYLAEDLKHQRKVAVKVLRPDLAAVIGSDRFLHEIRVTANLQHPHILPLFDSGAAGGTLFYVMPFVEGESLRRRLLRERQLPVEEACRVVAEVGSALDYAHGRGLIHRDIKPENVLMQDGRALVADFGIALAIQTAGGNRLTESGLALGTPEYMSPEQAAGDRQLDPRTDIYSLGCLAYEMLAGEPPHQGPTAQAIIARVMTEAPRPLTVARPTVPPAVAAAVHRALERSPADRFGSAAEFVAALSKPPTATVQTSAGRARQRVTPGMVAAGIVLLAVGAAIGRLSVGRVEPIQQRTELYLGTDSSNQVDERYPYPLRISRDGRRIVYVGRTPKGTILFLRSLGDRQARPIAGSEGASTPAFSPDGDSVAFFVNSAIRKLPVVGGRPITLVTGLEIPEFFNGLDWGSGGTLIYSTGRPDRLFSVSAVGGRPPTQITTDSADYLAPTFLPGGRGVLAQRGSGDRSELVVVPIPAGPPQKLGIEGDNPRYSAGQVTYFGPHGTLFTRRFDPTTLRLDGNPSVVSGDVEFSISSQSEYDLSESGTMVHVARRSRAMLVLVDSNRTERVLVVAPVENPRFSPTGDRIVYQADSGLWMYSFAQGTTQRLVTPVRPYYPTWSPGGRTIVFSGMADSDWDLWSVRADGGTLATRLLRRPLAQFQPSFTRDGKWITFIEWVSGVDRDLAVVSTGPEPHAEVLFVTPFLESLPTVSPDGRWLAYVSNESGGFEVYVRPFRREGGRQVISLGGGDQPFWSGTGREIYYRHGSEVVAATVAPGDPFQIRNRRVLFDRPDDVVNLVRRDYDATASGSKFVFVTRPGGPQIVVTLGALSGK